MASAQLRERAVEHVLQARSKGLDPVVVVSAMGRRGDPYATDTLLELLEAVGGPVSPREKDQLLACGEIISCALMAHTLTARGCPALSLTGAQAGIVTDGHFGNARILHIKKEKVQQVVQQGCVPVVAGFQGINQQGEVTTLGRGGSDTTAAALGSALGAVAVEIYTDVDGIMTADPQLVPEASILSQLTYQEVAEMAHLGAKVIHPRAVEIARQARLPLRVLGTAGKGNGTLIADGFALGLDTGWKDRLVTGIAHVCGRAQVRVEGKDGRGQQEVALQVFSSLARQDISLDMILLSPQLLLFVIDDHQVDAAAAALEELGVAYRIRKGFAKVSAVGAGMHGVPGVMAQVLQALQEKGIAVHQTTDSQANISCLVEERDLEQAVRALHQRFCLPPREREQAHQRVPLGAQESEGALQRNGFKEEVRDTP